MGLAMQFTAANARRDDLALRTVFPPITNATGSAPLNPHIAALTATGCR